MIAATASSSILVILTRLRPAHLQSMAGETQPSLTQTFRDLGGALRRPIIWLALAFALTSGAAFEAVGAVQGPMLRHVGFTTQTVGWILAGPMVACMLIGSLVGGYITDRIGHRRAVRAALLATVTPIALLAWALAVSDGPMRGTGEAAIVVGLLAATFLAIGLFVASSYAYFMDLSATRGDSDDTDEHGGEDPEGRREQSAAGTRFSAFMGATNGCEAWAGYGVGEIGARAGYAVALVAMCAVSLAGLVMVRRGRTSDRRIPGARRHPLPQGRRIAHQRTGDLEGDRP
jgi:MFS family permease